MQIELTEEEYQTLNMMCGYAAGAASDNKPLARSFTLPMRLPPYREFFLYCSKMKKIAGRWSEFSSPLPYNRAFRWGYCSVFVGQEPIIGWHLSISCPNRYPTWEEIKAARYDLIPHEVTMAMILPPPDEYVNLHPNCFHLHQIPGNDS